MSEIKVPDIGADEVEVTEILVKAGDNVAAEQSLITVEGDKASMEVPSPEAGVVQEIKIAVGDKVETGKLIMIFASAKETKAPAEKDEQQPAESASAAGKSQEVAVPDIGSDEVEVTEILVNVGDNVTEEQSLITVEGDKASMEVPAPFAGKVKEIKILTGDKVSTGSLIMLFDTPASASSATESQQQTPPAEETAASENKEVAVPDIGSDEVEVTEVLVSIGDSVDAEQSLITVEGDKASMEVPAPFAGKVKEIKIATGDKVSTGSLIMLFETRASSPAASSKADSPSTAQKQSSATTPAAATKKQPEKTETSQFVEHAAYVHATPIIRRLAREFGVNLAEVKASGRKGRVLKEDLQSYVKDALQRAAPSLAAGGGVPGMLPWPKVDFSKFGEIEEVEMGRIQKISGANLSRNWAMIPHVTQHDEADITEVENFRKQQNSEAEKNKLDVKITPLVFLMKASARALEAFPRFNSSLSEDGQKLTLKKYINIGVAVDTPNGLVVPVFRDVNKKGIIELSRELAVISKKARDGKLTAGDMQGGCFTLSSLGGIGGTAFTPIVNAPEVAILGVSKSAMKPHWNGKEFVPRLMLPLSLSFDHRVIDGAAGARFVTYLSAIMADIRRLVM